MLISAVQNCESAISIHIPIPREPPSHAPSCPTPLGCHRAHGWVPCVIWQLPTSCLFYLWWRINICLNATLSVCSTLSFPCCVHKSILYVYIFIQFSSVAQLCLTLCDLMDCSTPGFPVHHQLKLMSMESVMPSNHLILCCPLLLPPSIFPSITDFPNESVLRIRWSKYWSFSFSISPSNEYSGLVSFRMDLLEVQGTLGSLLQHHSSKASILWCSALFIVQLSYPYMTTGKTIALTRQTFVGKVMSLLFNYSCPANGFISTVFLDSIYMCANIQYLFFSNILYSV